MTKYLISWKVNPQMLPASTVERMKLLQSMNEMIRVGLRSGEIVDWGEYCDGSGGYALGEGTETEIYARLMRWKPYYNFDAKPVLTIDQVIDLFENASNQGFTASNSTPIKIPLTI